MLGYIILPIKRNERRVRFVNTCINQFFSNLFKRVNQNNLTLSEKHLRTDNYLLHLKMADTKLAAIFISLGKIYEI